MTAESLCACGKPAAHIAAPIDSADWPCRVPSPAVWHTALVLDEPRQEIGTHTPLIGQDDAAAALLLSVDDRAEVLLRWPTLELALAFGMDFIMQIRHAQQLEVEAARR